MIPGDGEYPLTSALPSADDESEAECPVVVRLRCENQDERVAAALEALRDGGLPRGNANGSPGDSGDDDDDDPTLFDGYIPIIGGS